MEMGKELDEPMYGPGPDGKLVPLDADTPFAQICDALHRPNLAAAYERTRRCEVDRQTVMEENERGICQAIAAVGELPPGSDDQPARRIVYFEHDDRSPAGLYGCGAEGAPYLDEPEYQDFDGPEYFRVRAAFSYADVRQPLWNLEDAVKATEPEIDTDWSIIGLLLDDECCMRLQRLYALQG